MIDVLCGIQARMGSSRLPGKVLKEICGKTLIQHIIDRLQLCKTIEKIVVLTSTETSNDALVETLLQAEVDVFRGSEDDVLNRYYNIISIHKPNHIVRVCADNPLIDPIEVDRIIEHHIKKEADYSFNHIPADGNGYPDGVGAEIFRSSVICDIIENKQPSTKEREHVNGYIWNHRDKYHVETITADKEIAFSEYRLDVDTADDLKFVRDIYQNLYKGEYFGTDKVIHYLQKTKMSDL